MRLIDADALVKPFLAWKDRLEGRNSEISKCAMSAVRTIIRTINAAPTITPERVKGEWIKIRDGFDNDLYVCQRCAAMCQGSYNFCPECGADMRGE